MFVSIYGYEQVQIKNLKRNPENGVWTWQLRYSADFTDGAFTNWFEFKTSNNGAGLFIYVIRNGNKEWDQLHGLCDWKINAKTRSGAYRKIKRLYGKYI